MWRALASSPRHPAEERDPRHSPQASPYHFLPRDNRERSIQTVRAHVEACVGPGLRRDDGLGVSASPLSASSPRRRGPRHVSIVLDVYAYPHPSSRRRDGGAGARSGILRTAPAFVARSRIALTCVRTSGMTGGGGGRLGAAIARDADQPDELFARRRGVGDAGFERQPEPART